MTLDRSSTLLTSIKMKLTILLVEGSQFFMSRIHADEGRNQYNNPFYWVKIGFIIVKPVRIWHI